MLLVRNNEEEESRKICDIAQAPKLCELENDRIMVNGGYVFVYQAMKEQTVAGINNRYVKVDLMKSKMRHCLITAEEMSQKFNIGIEKVKDSLRTTSQKGIIPAVHPLHCRNQVHRMKLNMKRLNV